MITLNLISVDKISQRGGGEQTGEGEESDPGERSALLLTGSLRLKSPCPANAHNEKVGREDDFEEGELGRNCGDRGESGEAPQWRC